MATLEKEFDAWNEIKKLIDRSGDQPERFPKEGEVWMAAIGKNIGFEQNGGKPTFSRPILIIKKFNNHMFWAVPLSTKQKNIDFYRNFTDPNSRHVSVILAQLKLVSIKRLRRKLYDMPRDCLHEIRGKLKTFL
jgi:mRNA interferase MazF